MPYKQIDYRTIHTKPLSQRISKFTIDEILIDPELPPPDAGAYKNDIQNIAEKIRRARQNNQSVMLAYGAHLIKNGLGPTITRLLEAGWITHLATHGAGTIHDWEYAFQGRSEEDVKANVAQGCFGTWEETGRNIHLSVLIGALEGRGYGESLGKFICEDGCTIPPQNALAATLKKWAHNPSDNPAMPACAELLQTLTCFHIPSGHHPVLHPNKSISLTANAYRLGIPLTVHPGIGYDIIYNHPLANGAALGRGADIDYRIFVDGVCNLGVFLSVGSAIMAPQVFEKAMSLANHFQLQKGKPVIHPHIVVNDLSEAPYDWSQGEPPKDNPAYYLRYCKSFSRMGGHMTYISGDNRMFIQNLYHHLKP